MPAEVFLIEGKETTVEQVFTSTSSGIRINNTGSDEVDVHLVELSPAYNADTYQLGRGEKLFLNIITDKIKFTFDKFSKIELVEII